MSGPVDLNGSPLGEYTISEALAPSTCVVLDGGGLGQFVGFRSECLAWIARHVGVQMTFDQYRAETLRVVKDYMRGLLIDEEMTNELLELNSKFLGGTV